MCWGNSGGYSDFILGNSLINQVLILDHRLRYQYVVSSDAEITKEPPFN